MSRQQHVSTITKLRKNKQSAKLTQQLDFFLLDREEADVALVVDNGESVTVWLPGESDDVILMFQHFNRDLLHAIQGNRTKPEREGISTLTDT